MGPRQEQVFQELYDAYEAEKGLYERLRDLSGRQLELLSNGQQEQAAEVVREKGDLIAEIGAMEERLEPVRQTWEEIRGEQGIQAEKPLADLAGELRGLIETILEQDSESEILLKQLTEEAARQMHQARQGREAAAAYQSQNQPAERPDPSCLVDRRE